MAHYLHELPYLISVMVSYSDFQDILTMFTTYLLDFHFGLLSTLSFPNVSLIFFFLLYCEGCLAIFINV